MRYEILVSHRTRILLWHTAKLGNRLPEFEIFISHIQTYHMRQDSSERVIISSQRTLPIQHTASTRNESPSSQRDSKPRFLQSSSY